MADIDSNTLIELTNVDLDYSIRSSLSVREFVKSVFSKEFFNQNSKYRALDNVNLTIKKGAVIGLIGNNGAGKSTLLKVIGGMMAPSKGTVQFKTKSISLLSLGAGFIRELTGIQNIFISGLLLGMSKQYIKDNLQDIIEYSELGDFINRPIKTYSSGMVSRLGFSIVTHLKPEILLIDEVLSVGDLAFKEKSFRTIKEYIQNKTSTVVIVSHSMDHIQELCTDVIWLDKGRVQMIGKPKDVVNTYIKK